MPVNLDYYGVLLLSPLLLCTYWESITILVCTGGYYGAAFKGFWYVTQRYPMSPTILNVVVDMVVHHCVSLVLKGEE